MTPDLSEGVQIFVDALLQRIGLGPVHHPELVNGRHRRLIHQREYLAYQAASFSLTSSASTGVPSFVDEGPTGSSCSGGF